MIPVLECAPNATRGRPLALSPLSAAPATPDAGADATPGEVKRGTARAGRASEITPAIQLTFPGVWDPCVASQRPGLTTYKARRLDNASVT